MTNDRQPRRVLEASPRRKGRGVRDVAGGTEEVMDARNLTVKIKNTGNRTRRGNDSNSIKQFLCSPEAVLKQAKR